MKLNKYPDGSSYVSIVDGFHRKVVRVNSYEDLWHVNQLVDAYNYKHKQRPTIIIPNLIDAQADRRFFENQSSGLKLVCKFLNGMNAKFEIFHPHNSEVVEALIDDVEIIDNVEFIKIVLAKIGLRLDDKEGLNLDTSYYVPNLTLMSSDAGGFKPMMKLCDKINWYGEVSSASKARTIDGMKQIVDRGNFNGKDVLIIDDLCVRGGTFKGLSKLLRERNAGKIYLAVSHMTIQDLGEDPVTNYFDRVFTTNSKFDSYEGRYKLKEGADIRKCPDNLEVIKMFQ